MIKKMCIGLQVKYPFFLSSLNKTGIFLIDFRKIFKCKTLWKSAQWEPSCSMRTDGRTEMAKLIFANLGFVVPCIFNHSYKNTQLDATINRKILLLCRTDTAQHISGITMPIIKSPSNCRCSLWFPYECGGGSLTTAENTPPSHSYGNQRLQRQFDGLLMLGIVMPETCWAVSVRQSNKFYYWLLHLDGCFYLINICFLQFCERA